MRLHKLELIDARGRYHVPDPQILALAEEIIDAFIQLRPQYIPGHVSVPAKAYIKFYEAARMCRQQRLTAEQFVAQQLKGMALTGKFWPGGISKNYESESAHQGQPLNSVVHYKAQLVIYRARATLFSPRELLADDRGPFTPLFRLAMAYELGYPDLVTQLRDRARIEFLATKGSTEIFPHLKGMFT